LGHLTATTLFANLPPSSHQKIRQFTLRSGLNTERDFEATNIGARGQEVTVIKSKVTVLL
jgi:hypothetical protein